MVDLELLSDGPFYSICAAMTRFQVCDVVYVRDNIDCKSVVAVGSVWRTSICLLSTLFQVVVGSRVYVGE